ncbi:Glyoxalase/bleomycin resistance protein/dioxygenase [Cordyceps fumosorosea ARSEF 2679]|uniref:Glyoxalase/bleomycin resistance protein/dioxygenase n=1 Tax=Cordyceps fumosorosea (strain ARSEF 2679) TaxID=1081104 RepID=A0A168EI99_CORFA|nr:Glyoxalase/bleomycin resistance protein/dioxygenase [Cordyceps fumosorosea ARSEF 2679]OAA73840.1 Glyoxalase/bleomycin resistance protein/dioxygenase [Cordyceps fumosorosea ARSEF 2679]
MFDHVALSVPQDKYPAVVAFYVAALAPLGYEQLVSMFDGRLVALGDKNSPMANKADFWLSGMAESSTESNYAHWAFAANDHTKVDEFYAKALAAGGKDNGAPGPRPHFGPHYYAAFVIDPMGNNVEVVKAYFAFIERREYPLTVFGDQQQQAGQRLAV